MADISQITLPDGNTYNIKDTVARDLVSNGGTFVIAWNGSGAPIEGNVPAGVAMIYNEQGYTGALAATADTLKKFYLVKSSTQQNPTASDIYDEYVTINVGTAANPSYTWEKIGDTQIKLSEIVKGVTPVTSKLVTTTIKGVDGTTTASKVSALTDQTTATGGSTSSSSTDAWLKGWAVSGEVLSISGVTMNTQTTKQIKIDEASVTVPVANNSATTVATGSLNVSGAGASVVTGVNLSM